MAFTNERLMYPWNVDGPDVLDTGVGTYRLGRKKLGAYQQTCDSKVGGA